MMSRLCSITLGLILIMTFMACASDSANQNEIFHKKKNAKGTDSRNNMRGWFELNTKTFYPENTAKEKTHPYVEGIMTEDGFIPDEKLNFGDK